MYWQILEAEGMAVPEEVSRILQVVSQYLQDPCPITRSVSTSCTDGQPYLQNSAETESDQVRCAYSTSADVFSI